MSTDSRDYYKKRDDSDKKGCHAVSSSRSL